jgi:hypothetical protein
MASNHRPDRKQPTASAETGQNRRQADPVQRRDEVYSEELRLLAAKPRSGPGLCSSVRGSQRSPIDLDRSPTMEIQQSVHAAEGLKSATAHEGAPPRVETAGPVFRAGRRPWWVDLRVTVRSALEMQGYQRRMADDRSAIPTDELVISLARLPSSIPWAEAPGCRWRSHDASKRSIERRLGTIASRRTNVLRSSPLS